MDHDCNESEGICVLLLGSKFGSWKRVSLREEVWTNFSSGYRND